MTDGPENQQRSSGFNWEQFNASIGRDVQTQAGSALRDDAYKNSVAFVLTRRAGDATTGGSGFFVDKDGLMSTDYHVIQDEKKGIVVKTADGQWHTAHVVNTDTAHDLALLKVDPAKPGETFIPVELASSSQELKGSDAVTTRGYPHRSVDSVQSDGAGNKFLPLSTWNVNDGLLPGESPDRKMILSQMGVQKGDSGGPLIRKSDGKVVGIVDFEVDDKNQTVSTPVEDLIALIARTKNITAAAITPTQYRTDGGPLYPGTATGSDVGWKPVSSSAPAPYQFKWPQTNYGFAPSGTVASEFRWRPVGQ